MVSLKYLKFAVSISDGISGKNDVFLCFTESNDCILELDMSWNHIRLLGAIAWGETIYVSLHNSLSDKAFFGEKKRFLFLTIFSSLNTFYIFSITKKALSRTKDSQQKDVRILSPDGFCRCYAL